MKKALFLFLGVACVAGARAAVLQFDLSPPGATAGAGLTALNEVIFTPSAGTGNEVGGGITFDTITLMLTLNVGYGSATGFHDLSSPAFAWFLHGPANAGETAPSLFDLATLHSFASDPARGGMISGSLTYTPEQAADLMAGLDYINIYTPAHLGGEIRGQLVMVPEPGSVFLMGVGGLALLWLTRARERRRLQAPPRRRDD